MTQCLAQCGGAFLFTKSKSFSTTIVGAPSAIAGGGKVKDKQDGRSKVEDPGVDPLQSSAQGRGRFLLEWIEWQGIALGYRGLKGRRVRGLRGEEGKEGRRGGGGLKETITAITRDFVMSHSVNICLRGLNTLQRTLCTNEKCM